MNFKKMLCTVIALVVTPMVFAGNTSEMQIAMNDFSNRQAAVQQEGEPTFEEMLDAFFGAISEMLPPQTQQDKNADQAIKAGFLKLLQDDEKATLNENEQAIITTLFQEIPAASEQLNTLMQNKDITLRELEAKQAEVAAKVNKLFGNVAERLIKNQSEIAADKVNMERATQVTALFYSQLIGAVALSEMGDGFKE